MLNLTFIAGCFDGPHCLHPGHLHLLTEASKLGPLFVAINRDEYVARKGPGRPLQPESRRAKALFDTGLVSAVAVIDDSPLDLILRLKPSFIVVGDDYTVDQVVGAKEAEAWGGKTVIVPRIPGWSTTELINGR